MTLTGLLQMKQNMLGNILNGTHMQNFMNGPTKDTDTDTRSQTDGRIRCAYKVFIYFVNKNLKKIRDSVALLLSDEDEKIFSLKRMVSRIEQV
jgi:hypothetical protein